MVDEIGVGGTVGVDGFFGNAWQKIKATLGCILGAFGELEGDMHVEVRCDVGITGPTCGFSVSGDIPRGAAGNFINAILKCF